MKHFSTPKIRAISRPVDFAASWSNETVYEPVSLISEVIEEINKEGSTAEAQRMEAKS